MAEGFYFIFASAVCKSLNNAPLWMLIICFWGFGLVLFMI